MKDDPINILIIDDEQISNIILSRYLELHAKVSIHIELNGKDAIDYLSTLKDADSTPQVIFLDIRMPIMDGFEFLEIYQKKFAPMLNSDLVVLTSSMDQRDLLNAERYNFVSYYIQKPISPEKINKILKL